MAAEPELVGDHPAPAPPVADPGAKPGGDGKKEPDKAEAKPEGKPDGKPARDYERELADMKRQLDETNNLAIYWHKAATGKGADADDEPEPKPKATKPAPDDDEAPEKFVDKLATLGPKAIDELLEKRGYISAKQVQELLDNKVGQITREAELYAKYPDLRDDNSELFKETQKEFQAMVSLDKSLGKNPVTVQLAARNAAAKLEAAKKIAEAAKPKETEADRRARIAAQMGDPGRGAADFEDGDDAGLTELQKDMMRKFNQAGGGPDITEEALIKHIKAGPRMIYKPGRDAQGRFQ